MTKSPPLIVRYKTLQELCANDCLSQCKDKTEHQLQGARKSKDRDTSFCLGGGGQP